MKRESDQRSINMDTKPELIPVEAPWTIGVHSEISIQLNESGSIVITSTVSFIKGDANEAIGYALVEYVIDIVFFDTIWLITNPVSDDHKDFYEGYIYSAVEPRSFMTLRQYRLKWLESGLCPDPHMYVVHRSKWNPSPVLMKKGYKHYVILGRDICIDVFGNKWDWQNKRKMIYQ